MRRLVAFLLAQSLIASTSVASSLHVHEYVGHDHPDHHHGPAVHDHPGTADRDHHGHADDEAHPAWEADPCGPGRHAVAVSIGCASVPPMNVDLAELPGPTLAVPSSPIRSAVPFTDVRVHGPPFDARTASRAPPVAPHA